MQKIHLTSEKILVLLIVALCAVISFINPTFFSVANFCDMVRSSTVNGIYAVGVMLVLISGGIDISFPSIAAFAMYATVKIFNGIDYEGTFLLPLLVSAIFGLIMGSFNGYIIHKFKLPTLIATLGTANLFNGILLTFLGSAQINSLPRGYTDFTRTYLVRVASEYGMSSIPIAFVIWVVVALIVWYILKFTLLGPRCIRAGRQPRVRRAYWYEHRYDPVVHLWRGGRHRRYGGYSQYCAQAHLQSLRRHRHRVDHHCRSRTRRREDHRRQGFDDGHGTRRVHVHDHQQFSDHGGCIHILAAGGDRHADHHKHGHYGVARTSVRRPKYSKPHSGRC